MAISSFKMASQKNIPTHLDEEDLIEISQALASCLANTQLLFQKTQSYHWNVTGSNFYSLHKLFEKQYNILKNVGDVIAERIRALGQPVPGTFNEFKKRATIKEDEQLPVSWQEMATNLMNNHENCSGLARQTLEIAEKVEDDVSANIMVDLMDFHEKSAWMLRSTLEAA